MPIAADPTPLGPHLTNTVDKTGKVVKSTMVMNPVFSGQALHQKNVERGTADHIEGEHIPALMHMLNQDVPVLKEDALTTDESTPEVTPVPHSTIEEKKVDATEATARVTDDKPVTDGENDTVVKVESAPVESAPVETAPVESAPVETAPVESAPVETAPVEAPVASEQKAAVAELERSFKSTLLKN